MSTFFGYNFTEKDKPVPARKRFTDPQAVYSVYDQLKAEDTNDAKRRAKIRAMYDGALPYDAAQLREKGLANMTNLNFYALKGTIDSRADAIMHLTSDTCDLVELSPVAQEATGPDDQRISTVVAEEFSIALRAGGHTIPALSTMNREADLYGIGPVTWRNDDDFEPLALERGQLKFRGDGSSVSSDHDLFMFESELPATYVFSLLDNEVLAKKAGWDPVVLKDLVVKVYGQGQDISNEPENVGGLSSYESVLALVRTNTFYETHQFDKFEVLHVYVREMAAPRGVTHIIVPGQSANTKKFLFYKENAYDTMDQCIVWLPFTTCERYARSVRGLASALVPLERVSDRLTGAIIDSAFRASHMILQQKNVGASPAVTLSENGPTTIVAAELEPVANAATASNLQAVVQIRQFMSQLGSGAVAGLDLAPVSTGVKIQQGGPQVSKAEAEIQEHRRLLRDENLFSQRLSALDKIFAECFRRFMKLVLAPQAIRKEYPLVTAFIENCSRRGVPYEVLKVVSEHFIVTTCRDLVLGSDGKFDLLGQLMQMTGGNLDEAGRKAMTHDMYRLRFGRKDADRYCPMESRDSAPSDQASFALMENAAIKRLEPVLVGPDQRHWSHIPIHAQVLQEIQQAVQQGIAKAQQVQEQGEKVQQSADGELAPVLDDPKQMADILQAASQHIQEHLAIGAQQLGAKPMAEQVTKMLKDLAPVIKALNLAIATQRRVQEAEAEKQQREKQALEEQASQAEMQKAMAKIQADKEVGLAKVKADHDIDIAKLQLERELNNGKLQNDREHRLGQLSVEGESARARASNEAAATRSAIENRRAVTDSAVSAAQSKQDLNQQFAQKRMAGNMSGYVANARRLSDVTGRGTVQPSEVINQPQSAPEEEVPTDDGNIPL